MCAIPPSLIPDGIYRIYQVERWGYTKWGKWQNFVTSYAGWRKQDSDHIRAHKRCSQINNICT